MNEKPMWQWFLWFSGVMGMFLGTSLCATPVIAKCFQRDMPSEMTLPFSGWMVFGSLLGLVANVWWMGRGQYKG